METLTFSQKITKNLEKVAFYHDFDDIKDDVVLHYFFRIS